MSFDLDHLTCMEYLFSYWPGDRNVSTYANCTKEMLVKRCQVICSPIFGVLVKCQMIYSAIEEFF